MRTEEAEALKVKGRRKHSWKQSIGGKNKIFVPSKLVKLIQTNRGSGCHW